MAPDILRTALPIYRSILYTEVSIWPGLISLSALTPVELTSMLLWNMVYELAFNYSI